MTHWQVAVFGAEDFYVSETITMKNDPQGDVARLRPFVRVAQADWRGPWFIEERRVMDYLLVYINEGMGAFSVGSECFDVRPGDVIWIPPDTLHEMRGHPPKMHVLYIHFDLLWDAARSSHVRLTTGGERNLSAAERRWMHPPLRGQAMSSWCGKLPVVNASAIHALIWQACVEHAAGGNALLLSGLLLQIVGEIERGLSRSAWRAGVHWNAMQRAAADILRHTDADLDLDTLARNANLSVSHFRRLFRSVHRQSPREMYLSARIRKACELMLTTRDNFTAIGEALGFSTVHNFSRAFRREMGVSPRAYKLRAGRRLSS